MSNEVNSGIVQKEVETLTLVERAEVGSAIGTGILALTYVSGYLTATSYLGTFGIPADASELFRAKYIYIGFEYWLFVAIFGVCFYAANLLVRLCKVAKADEEERKNERERVTAELVRRRLSREAIMERTRALRWGWVMALISVVFSFEILFMNAGDFRDYLPLQAMFLLFLSLYQTTFYREYSNESYGWGVLWGVVWVRCIRWVYSIGFGVVFAGLLLLKAFLPGLSSDYKLWILFWVGSVFLFLLLLMLLWIKLRFLIAWIVICSLLMLGPAPIPHLDSHAKLRALFGTMGIILFLITLVVAFFVTLGSSHLKWADEKAPRPQRHWVVLMVIAPWYILRAVCHAFAGIKKMTRPEASTGQDQISGKQRIIAGVLWIIRRLDSVFIPLLASGYCAIAYLVWMGVSIHFLADNHLAIICGYCTLIIALVVLANILLLSRKHGEREQDLKIRDGVLKELKRRAKEKSHGEAPVELPTPEPGWMRWTRLIVPIGILYLVSVLGFANLIYPFIPVDKAGGNYSTISPILIGLNNGSAECNSAELPGMIQQGRKYYVIEQSSDWLYVARNDSGQGPDCWKWGIFCKRGTNASGATPVGIAAAATGVLTAHLPYFRPEIHQVDRRCIASVDSAP